VQARQQWNVGFCAQGREKIRSLRQFWGKLLGFHPFNKA
jgi:hypothetical protein